VRDFSGNFLRGGGILNKKNKPWGGSYQGNFPGEILHEGGGEKRKCPGRICKTKVGISLIHSCASEIKESESEIKLKNKFFN
jgi:hypothetical protein